MFMVFSGVNSCPFLQCVFLKFFAATLLLFLFSMLNLSVTSLKWSGLQHDLFLHM